VGAAVVQIRDIGEGRPPTDFSRKEETDMFLKGLGIVA
jgi:hypothetical protein